jgi:hypothetical protein
MATAQENIIRAMNTTRAIGGTVRSISRGPRNSWVLTIETPAGLYPIAVWDDGKPHQDAALSFRKGDIATLQIHAYEHPYYSPWKIWDVLSFDQTDYQRWQQLDHTIRDLSASAFRSFDTNTQENNRLGEIEQAHNNQLVEQEQQRSLRQLAGISTAFGALIAAPFTSGLSLTSLPAAAVMLSPSRAADSVQSITLRHRREDVQLAWQAMQATARRGIQAIDCMEDLFSGAKLQPWKDTGHGNSYGVVPPELRQELQAVAQATLPAAHQIIDVSARGFVLDRRYDTTNTKLA